MKVTCPKCKIAGHIDESKIPNIDVIFAIEDFSILYQSTNLLKKTSQKQQFNGIPN